MTVLSLWSVSFKQGFLLLLFIVTQWKDVVVAARVVFAGSIPTSRAVRQGRESPQNDGLPKCFLL